MLTGMSDEELMLRFAQRGDGAAFEALWGRHLAGLKRHLFHLCGNDQAAEDLSQEVWIRIFNAAGRYQPTAAFRTYMLHIAHNLFLDHCRRSGRLAQEVSLSEPAGEVIAETLAADEPDASVLIGRQQSAQALQAAIAELPLAQREVMVLYLGGCELAEMPDILGRPFEAIKSQYRYGLARLRQHLGGARRAAA